MSVIAKREQDGKVFNFIKGADMAIIPRMTASSKNASGATIKLMNEFASQGLRTLMFGIKVLESNYNNDNIKEIKEEILESDIELLGITGLEDLLQDNVASCIQDFRNSGIKVWMLTGDKGETAQNIGIACGLIDSERHEVVSISGITKEEVFNSLNNIQFKLG